MSSANFTSLLQSMALLSVFLLLGVFLRAKIKLFQKTFLPASVIGGFLLLILGPRMLNVLPFPSEWMTSFAALPGILIVPVVASVPLGSRIGGKKQAGKSSMGSVVFLVLMGMLMITSLQLMVGFGVNAFFQSTGYDLYDTFGWELNMGYSGGHGSAGTLGTMLNEAGLPYWETAQSVATTMATIGLIGGILIGIILINWAIRKGYTKFVDKPGSIPRELQVGYNPDVTKQGSMGRETTLSASIDPLAFHMALILAVCGMAYITMSAVQAAGIPGLNNVSIWVYAIIIMYIVWYIMVRLKLDFLVDTKVKSRISGGLTEFAVIAAIASMNLDAISSYLLPVVVTAVLGMIVTVLFTLFYYRKFVKNEWFEHAMAVLGMNTGVFLTGILLLRICDPETKGETLGNYSAAFSFSAVFSFSLMPTYLLVVQNFGVIAMVGYAALTFVVWLVPALVVYRLSNKRQ